MSIVGVLSCVVSGGGPDIQGGRDNDDINMAPDF